MIPYGIDNSISLVDLCSLSGIEERTVRAMIGKLRRSGCMICSNTDKALGKMGYYRPLTKEELEHFVRSETARIRTIAANIKPARDRLIQIERGIKI